MIPIGIGAETRDLATQYIFEEDVGAYIRIATHQVARVARERDISTVSGGEGKMELHLLESQRY